MIEYYTERMTKDWNQERYTVRKYHKWTKKQVWQEANQVPSKNEHTTYGGKKKPKPMQQRLLHSQLIAEKSNNSTMTSSVCGIRLTFTSLETNTFSDLYTSI